MDLPVYLFTGFLEAGKTKFIQETLEDERFNAGERTLLLLCEEGVEEYNPDLFSAPNVFIEVLEDESQLNADYLANLQMKHHPERVVLEYNGMWMLDDLYNNMPVDWVIYQELCFADANSMPFGDLTYYLHIGILVLNFCYAIETTAINILIRILTQHVHCCVNIEFFTKNVGSFGADILTIGYISMC